MPMDSWDDEMSQRISAQVKQLWAKFSWYFIGVLGCALLIATIWFVVDNRQLNAAELKELEQGIEDSLRKNLFMYPNVKFEVTVEECAIRVKKDIRSWCSNSSLATKTDQFIVMNEVDSLQPSELSDRNAVGFRFRSDVVNHRNYVERFFDKHRHELTSYNIEQNVPAATTFKMDTPSREATAYLADHNIHSYNHFYHCHGAYGMNSLSFGLYLFLKKSSPSSLLKSLESYHKQCNRLD